MLMQISPDFIKPGALHECTRFSTTPQQGGIPWQAIYIESIEVIGGQVFLGLRTVYNWKDENDYEIGNTVYYESLLMFNRIQKIGTGNKVVEENKIRNDRNLAIQKALQEQEQK